MGPDIHAQLREGGGAAVAVAGRARVPVVFHTGDTYMKDRYPFVDTGSGGTQAGFIAALTKALEITGPNTKIIPGHGEVGTKADLAKQIAMLDGAVKAVDALVKKGMDRKSVRWEKFW